MQRPALRAQRGWKEAQQERWPAHCMHAPYAWLHIEQFSWKRPCSPHPPPRGTNCQPHSLNFNSQFKYNNPITKTATPPVAVARRTARHPWRDELLVSGFVHLGDVLEAVHEAPVHVNGGLRDPERACRVDPAAARGAPQHAALHRAQRARRRPTGSCAKAPQRVFNAKEYARYTWLAQGTLHYI